MKVKSRKVIKICALSLSLLLVGGIAISPITKTYAQEQAGQEVSQNKRRIVIHYPKRSSGFKIYYWTEDENKNGIQTGKWADLVDDATGADSATATIDLSYGDNEIKLGYIVATQGFGKRDITDRGDQDQRYVDLDVNDTNEVFLKAGNFDDVTKKNNPNIKHPDQKTLSDLVKEKLQNLTVKDIRVWVDEEIDWNKAFERPGDTADDEFKQVNEALKNAIVTDISNRNSSTASTENGIKGTIRLTFKDKSTLDFPDHKLYVSDHITGSNYAPDDVVRIELKLGEGVKVDDGITTEGNKDNPKIYQQYKVKPNTNINQTKVSGLDKTVFGLITLKAQENYQNPKWKDKDGGTNFVVTTQNNVFTAVAEKIPQKPNKPLTPNEKPGNSDLWTGAGLLEAKSEKKAKPSEKEVSSYNKLRIARDKNVVSVRAAKLLLEIAPERVKNVKGELMKLIAKSEKLVKQADIILEKLEAKYEF